MQRLLWCCGRQQLVVLAPACCPSRGPLREFLSCLTHTRDTSIMTTPIQPHFAATSTFACCKSQTDLSDIQLILNSTITSMLSDSSRTLDRNSESKPSRFVQIHIAKPILCYAISERRNVCTLTTRQKCHRLLATIHRNMNARQRLKEIWGIIDSSSCGWLRTCRRPYRPCHRPCHP